MLLLVSIIIILIILLILLVTYLCLRNRKRSGENFNKIF